jgi:hypothetical protein
LKSEGWEGEEEEKEAEAEARQESKQRRMMEAAPAAVVLRGGRKVGDGRLMALPVHVKGFGWCHKMWMWMKHGDTNERLYFHLLSL